MNAVQFEALREAAASGIEYDGLAVHYDDDADSYTFETPDLRRTGLSEGELHRIADANREYVTNWDFFRDRSDDRRAFLRWLEGANEQSVPGRYDALQGGTGEGDGAGSDGHDGGGVTRSWGQLRVTATLGEDGARRYDLRHGDDADTPRDALDSYDDPLDARHLATYDERGRYRPLKTAPTLRTGWVFPALDADDLLQAVDFLYPATVANWYREREGELDVTHWRETAERQTGIYDIVDELSGEQVEWVAETCCVDSQCVKRRQWDEDDETELDVPRGDGEFPCREPCSLVVAAARKWTMLERETEREYTFTLTPSEKEQVEDVIDAVADGRVDEIREADVYEGANRYRTRFLRAKRFDDEGNLCGVPSEARTE